MREPRQQRRRREDPRRAARPARSPAATHPSADKSRRQAGRSPRSSVKLGVAACARATKSRIAGDSGELIDSQRLMRIGHGQRGDRQLVLAGEAQAATARRQHLQSGAGAEQSVTSGAASRRCSKLSRTSRTRSSRSRAIRSATSGASPLSWTSSRSAIAAGTSAAILHRGERDEYDAARKHHAGI